MLDLAIQHRLPVLASIRLGPSLGALMSYGSDYSRWGNRQTALTKRSIDIPSGRIGYTQAGYGPTALRRWTAQIHR
jgi:hypothetical protein